METENNDGTPSLWNSLQTLVQEQRITCEELEVLSGDFETAMKELAAREHLSALLHETTGADSVQPSRAPIPPLGQDVEVIFTKSRDAVARSQTLRRTAKRLRDGIAARSGHAPPPDGHLEGGHKLSRREREVLTLMVKGLSSKEIAAALGISFKTAVTHRASIMGKLDVHEIASVVREAILRGLV
jgi:DNA-binding CsgD family transcriptional regulator